MDRKVSVTWRRLMLLLTMAFALSAMVFAASASAQEIPFDSQYAPPPLAPPDDSSDSEGSDDSASGSGTDGVLADTEGPVVDLLPTTGGFPTSALLLGGSALLAGGALVAVRRRG